MTATNRDAAEALQKAIYTALSVALTPTKVYDHVPQDTEKPYVALEIDTQDWGDKSGDGTEAAVTVHIYSEYRGRKQVYGLRRIVHDALHHASLNVDNSNLVLLQFESGIAEREDDGLTYHALARFRALVEYTG